jgi:hypothetical protein
METSDVIMHLYILISDRCITKLDGAVEDHNFGLVRMR